MTRRWAGPSRVRAGIVVGVILGLCTPAPLSAAELPDDVLMGKKIYEQHCQKCHGAGGWGDGPQAQWQYLPPANFHAMSSKLKSDEQLATVIEHGVIFSPMHFFRGTLSATEIQDVVAYIRLLAQRGR
jgi:mono/diheme cytochrome c family protein